MSLSEGPLPDHDQDDILAEVSDSGRNVLITGHAISERVTWKDLLLLLMNIHLGL